jgi:tetratricopeptide (TPR) repeat protein
VAEEVERAKSHVTRGRELLAARSLGAACEEFRQASELVSAWWVAQLEYVRCARLRGEPPAPLIARLEGALIVEPNKASMLQELAELLESTGELERARALYRGLAEGSRDPASAWFGLARVEAALGHHDKAASLYRQWLETHPNDGWLRAKLAAELESSGDLGGAAEQWEQAADWSAHPPTALARAAQLYQKAGKVSEAARVVQRLPRSPDSP